MATRGVLGSDAVGVGPGRSLVAPASPDVSRTGVPFTASTICTPVLDRSVKTIAPAASSATVPGLFRGVVGLTRGTEQENTVSTVELTAEAFESTVTGEGIVLVDFWASWCGPCRAFAPVFEAAAEEHPEITFAKVDTEAEQELAGGLGIQSIPTLMIFRDGILMFSQPGALPKATLDDLIGQVEALDMDEVRKELGVDSPAAD
jgi:thioredoxin 1